MVEPVNGVPQYGEHEGRSARFLAAFSGEPLPEVMGSFSGAT